MPCIPILLLRGEAREKYGIEGSTVGDVGAACCCSDVLYVKLQLKSRSVEI